MSDAIEPRGTVMPAAPDARASTHAGALTAPGTVSEFLAFQMAEESYALPLSTIREILKTPPITPVPRAAHHVLGILSVRGRITTVVDLRRRLSLDESVSDKHTRVLLVDAGESEIMGLLVDRVHQVYRLADDEIEYAAVVGGDMSEYVLGIGRPKTQRGRDASNADEGEETVLILLDPMPLLRRER